MSQFTRASHLEATPTFDNHIHLSVAQKRTVPKWNPGKWKHGPKPAVCPSCLILTATAICASPPKTSPEVWGFSASRARGFLRLRAGPGSAAQPRHAVWAPRSSRLGCCNDPSAKSCSLVGLGKNALSSRELRISWYPLFFLFRLS